LWERRTGHSRFLVIFIEVMPGQIGPVLRETFAPILYVMRYS
jgi:hypothetical protein